MMSVTKQDQEYASINITTRLNPSDIRSVLAAIDQPRNGSKSVERIVSETENLGRAINDADLGRFLVDVSGPDLLDNRELRYRLALHASDPELDELRKFSRTIKGLTVPIIARSISEVRWHAGKRWARHFVSVLGFPPSFAGLVGQAGGPDCETVEPHIPLPPLEPFQNDLREQVIELLISPQGANRGILTLPTGAGKTRTTVEALIDWRLANSAESYLLWIAQSDELCEQAVQAFKEVWIDRGSADIRVRDVLKIYRFWGARQATLDEAEPGIIISTIDKLRSVLARDHADEKYQALMDVAQNLGLVVIDEAHGAEAPSYRKVLETIGIDFSPTSRSVIPVLGLTATPLRSQHDETIKLAKRFHGKLLRPRNLPEDPTEAIAALRTAGVLSMPTHQILKRPGKAVRLTSAQERYLEEWRDLHPELLMQLGQEKDRNRQLVQVIMNLDSSWPILFFGCSVQHAEAMAILLRRKGREAAVVTGETRDATRRHLIEQFRNGQVQVLCNYGVLTTGFDAPLMRAVIIGRPTTSRLLYEQMIGRGMRGPRFGGTEECLVIDIDDNLVHRDGSMFTTASQKYAEYWTNSQSLASVT